MYSVGASGAGHSPAAGGSDRADVAEHAKVAHGAAAGERGWSVSPRAFLASSQELVDLPSA